MANQAKRQSHERRMPSREGVKEFDQEIIDIARVTRVMAGGKRLRFRACVCIGDGNGKVGIATAKGADVTVAINKAANKARKHIITIPFVNETIPYEVREKYGSAYILLKPAPRGTGIKAGGSIRTLFRLAGVPNIVGKILGSKNKINNVQAALCAIKKLRYIEVKPKQENKKANSIDEKKL